MKVTIRLEKKKMIALKRIRCSQGAVCSNGENIKELGGKCGLGFVGVGHEAEIAPCIHYARGKLGVRCKDSAEHPTQVINLYRNITQSGL